MRVLSHVAAPTLLALALQGAPLAAQSDPSAATPLSVYAETRLATRYVWRGYDEGMKAASLQPGVELGSPYGFTTYAWATGGLDGNGGLDEVNLSVRYAQSFGDWEVGLGYLYYVLPGTPSEPGPEALNPKALATSAEVFVTLARHWGSGSATLTYSRGNRAMTGNSIALRVEGDYAWGGDRWGAQPYLQLDYLDAYGPPSRFADRFAMIEIGAPFLRRVGPVQLLLGAHVSFVPSPYIRARNAEAGSGPDVAIPWFTFGVAYEP